MIDRPTFVAARGRLVRGLRIASGAARSPRFPKGTIAPQLPLLRRAVPGFDDAFDGPLHLGTMNIGFVGRRVRVGRPEHVVTGARWSRRHKAENFFLSACEIEHRGRRQRGLLYIPDPATKPRHLPTGRYVEVLSSRMPRLRYGAPLTLRYRPEAIRLVPALGQAGRRTGR